MTTADKPHIHVVAGIIKNHQNDVLIAKRHQHLDQGGLWEFPGGKREPGESSARALLRELEEEIGVTVERILPFSQITHEYANKIVTLEFFEVTNWMGTPLGKEGQEVRWVGQSNLHQYAFPEANDIVLKALKFPRLMLVTPECDDEDKFIEGVRRCLSIGIACVQLRCTQCSRAKYRRIAERLTGLLQQFKAQLILNTAPEMLVDFPHAGLHLSSQMLVELTERPCDLSRPLTSVCHNHSELQKAHAINVDAVLVSPIRSTASHPQATPIGWQECANLSALARVPVFGLGGLTSADLPTAVASGCYGIAAIRGFWDEQCLPSNSIDISRL